MSNLSSTPPDITVSLYSPLFCFARGKVTGMSPSMLQGCAFMGPVSRPQPYVEAIGCQKICVFDLYSTWKICTRMRRGREKAPKIRAILTSSEAVPHGERQWGRGRYNTNSYLKNYFDLTQQQRNKSWSFQISVPRKGSLFR